MVESETDAALTLLTHATGFV